MNKIKNTLSGLVRGLKKRALLSHIPQDQLSQPYAPVPRDQETIFYNNVDGYIMTLPRDAKVDLSRSEAGILIQDSQRSISIFRQDLVTFNAWTYNTYSRTFFGNTQDHLDRVRRIEFWGGAMAEVNTWRRPKLSRVENDRNYYTWIDMIHHDHFFTVLIKTDAPIEQRGGYRDLLSGFYTIQPQHPKQKMPFFPATTRKNPETQALYEKLFGPEAQLTWGIFNWQVPEYMIYIQPTEAAIGYEFPILMTYNHCRADADPRGEEELHRLSLQLATCHQHSRTQMVTLQLEARTDGRNVLYDVLNGAYDGFLTAFARTIRDFGHPVLLRIANEMNGDWCSYCAFHYCMDTELYRTFYQYIVSFFEACGAENVIYVWNPHDRSFPDFNWNHMDMYYPDCGADVYGITGYNNGTFFPAEKWRTFREIYDPILADQEDRGDLPVMITEFSCADMGGDKARWIQDMFDQLPDYSAIKAAVWWNGYDMDANMQPTREYRMNHKEEYLEVFRKNLTQT